MSLEGLRGAQGIQPGSGVALPKTIREATGELMDALAEKGFKKLTIELNGRPITFEVPGDKDRLAEFLEGQFPETTFNPGHVVRALEMATEVVKGLPQQTDPNAELRIPIERRILR